MRGTAQTSHAKPVLRKEPSKRGGKRQGAGRKKTGRCHDAPHRARPELSARHPVHVVLRTVVRVSWRTREYYAFVQRALRGTLTRTGFRIVHVSIQHNHLHLLVEAADRKALTRGMQSFSIRLARIVHDSVGGCGKVFAFRYHATQIKTARHARHALAYVLRGSTAIAHAALSQPVDVRAQLRDDSCRWRFSVWRPRTRLLRDAWPRWSTETSERCPRLRLLDVGLERA